MNDSLNKHFKTFLLQRGHCFWASFLSAYTVGSGITGYQVLHVDQFIISTWCDRTEGFIQVGWGLCKVTPMTTLKRD